MSSESAFACEGLVPESLSARVHYLGGQDVPEEFVFFRLVSGEDSGGRIGSDPPADKRYHCLLSVRHDEVGILVDSLQLLLLLLVSRPLLEYVQLSLDVRLDRSHEDAFALRASDLVRELPDRRAFQRPAIHADHDDVLFVQPLLERVEYGLVRALRLHQLLAGADGLLPQVRKRTWHKSDAAILNPAKNGFGRTDI